MRNFNLGIIERAAGLGKPTKNRPYGAACKLWLGLLDADHNQPTLDCSDLLSLTAKLTRDMTQVEKMFRLMVFNVLINNTDDHAKNFVFLYDGKDWKLSPAFDLTQTIGNWEHATSVNRTGIDITGADMLAVAHQVGMTDKQAGDIMLEVKHAVD